MKHYFFRDLNHGDNLLDGKTYHSAGYVDKVYATDINTPQRSGKDLSVTFLKPFTGRKEHAWRALFEVELFEVDEWEWENAVKAYGKIES